MDEEESKIPDSDQYYYKLVAKLPGKFKQLYLYLQI